MEEIYRNRMLNYGYLTSLTLLSVIFIYNIISGKFDKFGGDIKLSDFSIKFILILVVFVSYISLSTPSFRMLGENKVLKKTPPRGDVGIRGNRGSVGEDAACNECGDDLCYKKMMFNITKTINFWKQQNGMELLDDNYVIENEYIKDRVKKHCKSKQFKKLISKFGSNNKDSTKSPQDIKSLGDTIGFGGYDYMFKMWSIWILIILRYKNGMFFLDSYGLKEADFDGLVEREDGFTLGTKVVKVGSSQEYTVVDKKEFPFYKIKNDSTTTISQEYINKLEPKDDFGWNEMFKNDTIDYTVNDKKVKEALIKTKTVKRDSNNIYTFEGINNEFITIIGEVPSGGKLNPFHEIKKYSSWLWGADPAGKPRFKVEREPENKVCRTCTNSTLCNKDYPTGSVGIKIKYSNSYSTIVDLTEFGSNENGGFVTPFDDLDTTVANTITTPDESNFGFIRITLKDSTLFRPQILIDESEPHPLFRSYRPVGDVCIKNSNYEESTDATKCKPSEMSYEGEIFESITGIGDKRTTPSENTPPSYNNDSHIYTLLVSGDTKPPKDYTLVASYNKTEGINRNTEGISIWKPIPECGYAALGFVVDMRTFEGTPPKPPRDLIATIPIASLTEFEFGTNSSGKTSIDTSQIDGLSNINTLCDIFPILPESSSSNPDCAKYTNSSGTFICLTTTEISTSEYIPRSPSSQHTNGQFKNKKYSIQKIFDNNNE
jgi:hypothetical protein